MNEELRIKEMIREATKLTLDELIVEIKTDRDTAILLLESGKIKSVKQDGEYITYHDDVIEYLLWRLEVMIQIALGEDVKV